MIVTWTWVATANIVILCLQLLSVPPQVADEDSIQELSVVMGRSISIECPITAGIPPPTIHWTREFSLADDAELDFEASESNVVFEKDFQVLRLGTAQLTDDGRWTCTASNIAGNSSREFILNVLGKQCLE